MATTIVTIAGMAKERPSLRNMGGVEAGARVRDEGEDEVEGEGAAEGAIETVVSDIEGTETRESGILCYIYNILIIFIIIINIYITFVCFDCFESDLSSDFCVCDSPHCTLDVLCASTTIKDANGYSPIFVSGLGYILCQIYACVYFYEIKTIFVFFSCVNFLLHLFCCFIRRM